MSYSARRLGTRAPSLVVGKSSFHDTVSRKVKDRENRGLVLISTYCPLEVFTAQYYVIKHPLPFTSLSVQIFD